MPRTRIFALTLLALLAFAGNSLLCRLALKTTDIDPATFTAIRLVSGACALWLIGLLRRSRPAANWISALALFAYAITFSFAYISLPAGTGALLLFGAVQLTMLGYALGRGERLLGRRLLGFALAAAGLVALLLPGLATPSLRSALLMLGAGIAWGIYTLRGRGALDPASVTAGNFALATIPALVLAAFALPDSAPEPLGIIYAFLSGAVTSGLGYVIWYAALRGLSATEAATVQLSVPVFVAMTGIALLGEPLTLRLVSCAVAILGGIALVLLEPARATS